MATKEEREQFIWDGAFLNAASLQAHPGMSYGVFTRAPDPGIFADNILDQYRQAVERRTPTKQDSEASQKPKRTRKAAK